MGLYISDVYILIALQAELTRRSPTRCCTFGSQSEDLFGTICSGCPDKCLRCSFGNNTRGSPTCTSLPPSGIEHATSDGGTTTIEELHIHKGFWRATNESTDIYKCFNSKACSGGLTSDPGYCHRGYEGPCERGSRLCPLRRTVACITATSSRRQINPGALSSMEAL